MFINRGKDGFPLEKDKKKSLIHLVAEEGSRGSETDGGQCEGQKAEKGLALVTLVTAGITYLKKAT